MKPTSTLLAVGTLALGVVQSSDTAAHTEKPIYRLQEIRRAYLSTLADRESDTAGPAEKRLAENWPNWSNSWNNWLNGWQNN